MCLQYFSRKYKLSFIKDQTHILSELSEIYGLVEYEEGKKTDITDEWVERVNKQLVGLKLTLKKDYTVNEFIDRFKRELPSIALYDQSFLMGGPRSDNHHASVIKGINPRSVTMSDPSKERDVKKDINDSNRV